MPVRTTPVPRVEPIPVTAGIGLRTPHHECVLADKPAVGWFEVHSENFFGAGTVAQSLLADVRRDYPLSLHGVGLSLGRADRVDTAHLDELKQLIEFIRPGLVSEHLSWGAIGERHLNDLLPLPYTEQALDLMIEHVQLTQEYLGRQILIENVSSYLMFTHSTIPEWEFVATLAERSGCGLLLDINNIHVNSVNHGFDPRTYIDAIPRAHVKEMHLAGFTEKQGLPVRLLIDTHSGPVADDVWQLYAYALENLGAVPTLIEWDQEIPQLETLLAEAGRAEEMLRHVSSVAA